MLSTTLAIRARTGHMVAGQQRDVFPPLAQRRNADGNYIQAIKKVGARLLLFNSNRPTRCVTAPVKAPFSAERLASSSPRGMAAQFSLTEVCLAARAETAFSKSPRSNNTIVANL
jgi:hypothetical protein